MIVLHVQQHHCLTAERQAIGALVVTLGGIDALVFTAGVGENASKIRGTSALAWNVCDWSWIRRPTTDAVLMQTYRAAAREPEY